MATWELTTSGSATIKAGLHANTITASGTEMAKMYDEAEGEIITQTRRDWVAGYSSLPTGIKGALSDVCSSMIGMAIAEYDPTGYLIREWDGVMNFNDDRITKGMAKLKDFKSNEIKTP